MAPTLPSISSEKARQVIAAFPDVHLLVVGDVMLDKFIVGRVTRLSPEAPVPVVSFDRETHRIGGAANVAHNATALGARATLIGVTGQDETAGILTRACREAGITASFVSDGSRPTTSKVRIVTERNQQVGRIDYESDVEIAGEVEQSIIAAVKQHAAHASAIVVSDYLKGCITARVVSAARGLAADRRIPLLVDPKIPHIDYYTGAAVVTPNHLEAESATHMRIRSQEDARAAARALRDRIRCGAVLMTRGDQGMSVLGDGVEGHLGAAAREVADVTGAGDTVSAIVALSLAAGATLGDAAHLANEAAGIVVAKFGPSTVSPTELLNAFATAAT
jgi:D-beta-D-heptose 7-phosphate kinase/D-beta-D-heptose 1-phosphate adenosyltransferase